MAALGLSGGSALEEKLKEMAERIGKSTSVDIGFMADATYPDGTQVAMVAAIHNFGAPEANIPPRPFFSQMVKEKSPDWGKSLGTALVNSDFDATRSLGLMGEGIKGQLQEAITKADFAPLSQATIDAKGFDKQLIDTGHMQNSAEYLVKE